LAFASSLQGNNIKFQAFLSSAAGLPGPKKLKRPNLTIKVSKKIKSSKNEKRLNKGLISLENMLK